MENPKELTDLAADAAARFPDDLAASIKWFQERAAKLEGFEEFQAGLIANALKELVYRARHDINTRIKKETGGYASQTKANGLSGSTEQAYKSVYDFCIAGQSLGSIKGADLAAIAEKENELANGHLFNSSLASWLAGIVPKDKTVSESVSEDRLRKAFKRLLKTTESEAA